MPNVMQAVIDIAKRAAVAESSPELKARHFLLGALAHAEARRLLGGPDNAEPMVPEALASWVANLPDGPPPTQSIPLGADIKEPFQELYRRQGGMPAFAAFLPVLLARDDADIRAFLDANPTREPAAKEGPTGASSALGSLIQDVHGLQNLLARKVIGQQGAVQQIADAVFQARVYHRAGEDTPQAVMLFLGPPGVGKTYTAQLIAHALHADNEGSFLRLDMSSYADHDSYRMLVGFEPSYQGARPGLLTQHVQENPDCLILVDEIEKASPTVHNLFLQILDRGQLEDKHTRTNVSFGRTMIAFTTNLGSELYANTGGSGPLGESSISRPAVLEALRSAVHPLTGRTALSPELCSRLAKGYPIMFGHLQPLDLEQIVQLAITELGIELEAQLGLDLEVADPRLLTAMILRLGPDLDARTTTAGIPLMIKDALRDVFTERRQELFGDNTFEQVRRLRIELPRGPERAFFDELAVGGRRVLVVSEGLDDGRLQENHPDLEWSFCHSGAEAVDVMRQQSQDLVLLDLDLGLSEGLSEGAGVRRELRRIRSAYPDAPVHLLCDRAAADQPDSEFVTRLLAATGAGSLLNGPVSSWSTGVDSPLERIRLDLLRDRYLRDMFRLRQTVRFEWELSLDLDDPKDGAIILRPHDLHTETVVASKDRAARLTFTGIPAERFADVAGSGEAKRRLEEVIGWIRNPDELRSLGIDLPSGILLEGPPGNGKTMLARATAGEANLPFFAVAATDFASKYVGESESNIRELFERAATYAPSILFIDEIDAIGAQRSSERTGINDSMLNQLLVSMDGFTSRDRPIFFLAATNRADMLDPALKRPGRFDLILTIEDLDLNARVELLTIMTRKLPLAANVDLDALARAAMGVSGAQLSQVVKEAAILAYREGATGAAGIAMRHFREALTNVRYGIARQGSAPPSDELRRTAIHEAGHALLAEIENPGSVHQATILPRGRALGFVESLPESEWASLTTARLRARIRVALAGRGAENLIYGADEVSSGCSQDLEHATRLASLAVSRFGMSDELGPVSLPTLTDLMPAGEASARAEAATLAMLIGEERAVAELLTAKRAMLDAIAEQLMQQETVTGAAIREIVTAGTENEVLV